MQRSPEVEALTAEILAEMARQRVSQDRLAGLIECSPSGLSRRLSGKTDLSVSEAALIGVALHVPLYELLRRSQGEMAA